MNCFSVVVALFSLALFVSAQGQTPAPLITNNPSMATYQAILDPQRSPHGTITGVSGNNGTGVDFNINFFDFPDPNVGPYSSPLPQLTFIANQPLEYHIHVFPVPEDGNCGAAGGHLDPYGVTDAYVCSSEAGLDKCQVGDLSGKHGPVDTAALGTGSFQVKYLDNYLSTTPGDPAFFGNRSIVVHDKDGKRLNCANFVAQTAPSTNTTGTVPGNYTTSPAPTETESAHATGVGGTTTRAGTTASSTSPGINHGVVGSPVSPTMNLVGLGLVAVGMAFL
jgi:hypothetical protein